MIGLIGFLFVFGIMFFYGYVMWRIYEKAGQPGWAALVPIYNMVVGLRIAQKPEHWILFMFIPFVNIYFAIKYIIAFAKAYGKDTGFAIGLIFLSFIFYPMMAFDDSIQYVGNRELNIEDHIIG